MSHSTSVKRCKAAKLVDLQARNKPLRDQLQKVAQNSRALLDIVAWTNTLGVRLRDVMQKFLIYERGFP